MVVSSEKSYQTGLKFLIPHAPNKVYSVVVKEMMQLLGAEYGSIFLERKGNLERVFASAPLLYKNIICQKDTIYQALHKQKTNITSLHQVSHIHPVIKELNIHATLNIPLMYKKMVVGVLTLDTTVEKNFTQQQLHRLEWLGSIAAISIQKSKEYKELKNSLENRDLFISMASHELKTPLTTINMYTQLLRKKLSAANSTETTWMDTLSSEINRLTMLVNDLLRVETIETGYMHYRWQVCSVQAIISRAIQDFKLNYAHKILVEDYLPTGKDSVWGDFDKLLQVIINVLNNAAKFSPANSAITITIKTYYHAIRVEIQDQGKGITKKDLPKVFDKYYRGNNKNVHAGMGIGLFLVKSIVENHNGKIAITSKINTGTSVYIILPQYKQKEIN